MEEQARKRKEYLEALRREEKERREAAERAKGDELAKKKGAVDAMRDAAAKKKQALEAARKAKFAQLSEAKQAQEAAKEADRVKKESELLKRRAAVRLERGGAVASEVTKDEQEALSRHFALVDADGSGAIDKDEFAQFAF